MLKFFLILILILFFFMFLILSINPQINNKQKHELMNYFYEDAIPYTTINKKNYKLQIDTFSYPLVFKPCLCSSFGNKVELIYSKEQALKYMEKNLDEEVMIQKLHTGPYEGTILFEKNPITKKINIIFVERINPKIKKSQQNDIWFWKSSDSYKYGYYSIHKPEFETQDLKNFIIKVCDKIPEFYMGRFDVRFKNHNDLKKGKNIGIIELNEQLCSDTRYNDKKSGLYNSYIFTRWLLIRIYFGFCNIIRGNGVSLSEYIKWFKTNQVSQNCYPKSKYINLVKKMNRSFLQKIN
jgi:hypothetical protein